MTPDLRYLVWTVLLTAAQLILAVVGATATVGLPKLAGNREDVPPIEGWAGRARRAHANMLESLPLFAALVLVAAVSGRADGLTALGAAIFFWARLAHAAIYIAGIPWLRTAAFGASIVGLLLIVARLF